MLAAGAVVDLHATATVLGKHLSSDLATRQRTALVGKSAKTPADLAVLAQLYRDPRFETFRVFFVNGTGVIVSQVGLTCRLPAAATAIMGSDAQGYLKNLAATAKLSGATAYYLMHNHPSGTVAASRADEYLTRQFATLLPLEFKGHVIIDTDKFTVIEADGVSRPHRLPDDVVADNKAPFMSAGEWSGAAITAPSDVMRIVAKLSVDADAATLICLSSQHDVRAISRMPSAAFKIDKNKPAQRMALTRALHRVLQTTPGAAKLIGVAASNEAARLMAASDAFLDVISVSDGRPKSLAEMGMIRGASPFPRDRPARVTPDSSPEFDYLRARATEEAQAALNTKQAQRA